MGVVRVVKLNEVKSKGRMSLIHAWIEASDKPWHKEMLQVFYGAKSRPEAKKYAEWLERIAGILNAKNAGEAK